MGVEVGDGSARLPERPKDPGGQSSETADDFDSEAEVLRDTAEDPPSGAARTDIEKTPVFDQDALAKTK